ncbi:MAG: RNA polymerase sigma factor [Psychrosphaera sp.]|nr:RNA polymerase sigma factor [Psychrosphaera sp.]
MQNENLLVQRAKSGDLQSFEQLVTLYSHRTYSAAYRILNDQGLAEDCAQEVFLKVFNKIGDFDGKSKFSTWLYSVTTFTAIDLQRKQVKVQQREGTEFEDIHGNEAHSPQQQLHQDKLNQVTQGALAQLSEELRIAFLLRHHEGCSIKEISEILDVNGNTIKNRIFRAISQLRNLLKSKVSDYETVD